MTVPAAIVLAAGGSRRLGQPKQLVVKDGESMLRRTVRMAIEVGCSPVVVVLGYEADLMERELEGLGVEVVRNARWPEGMGSSIGCGVAALLHAMPESIMVLVCDQPRLTEGTLRSLMEMHREMVPDITASTYDGALGVPAIFDRRVVPALMELKGEEGARKILVRGGWRVSAVEFDGGEIDIDLPSDLGRL